MSDNSYNKLKETFNNYYKVFFDEAIITLRAKETSLTNLLEQGGDMRFKNDITIARNNIRNAIVHIENALSETEDETIH
jgi:hypothetical protein